jgi:CheY-like chemotaxis protein
VATHAVQILSVDDDMVNQVVAEQIMRSQKTWKILKAYNGPQCLEMIERAQVGGPTLAEGKRSR